MANTDIRAESAPANPIEIVSILNAAWEAAYAIYHPIGDRWQKEFDAADEMPRSLEREAAFDRFYKVNLPRYQRARDELMRVPAPTVQALATKMEIADPTDDAHFDQCLADAKRLAA